MKWILCLWTVAALVVGVVALLPRLPAMAPQICLIALTIASLLAYFFNATIRRQIEALGWRGLLLPHLGRFVGIYFLYLYRQGRLPEDFAVRGGWGDIITASGACILFFIPTSSVYFRRELLVWNIFGFIDIGCVVFMAVRANLADASSMNELRQLPLSLLPMWLVPMIIASHIIIFHRLFRPRD